MHHAFGIAGYAATVPTLNRFQRSPHAPMTKYDHLGAMSRNGVEAALLAQRGFTGDLDVLEGEDGFWRFAGGSDGCDWEHLTRDLGTYWTVREMTHKPFPVNLYNQPHVVAVQQIVHEQRLEPEDIEEIEIRSSRTGGSLYPHLRGAIDAYRNQGYMLAAMIYDVRPLRSWHLPETMQRADLRALAHRVTTKPFRDGEVTSIGNYWERWAPVRVTVRANGRDFEGGSDELPTLDDTGVSAKFRENVSDFLSEADAMALEQACWQLATVPGARDISRHLQVQGAG
jgi:2-methylcitrate dehydratase PrpD